ncbi:MAG: HAD family hydrolase [Candidatus Omnitrophota bacterium]
MIKAVFLDRDGVINEYPGDFKYVTGWNEFRFLPEVKPALKKLNEHGWQIFIISNQAGISKGIYSQDSLDLITKNMLEELKKDDINILRVYYCVHRQEDNCPCRKPKAGLVHTAISYLKNQGKEIDLTKSYFIGDTIRDIETGRTAGLKTILVFSGKEKAENRNTWTVQPDWTAQNLSAAVDIILK